MDSPDHIHISASQRPLELKLGELWEYRELVLLITRRRLTVSYTQTILGPLWLLINPLLSSVVYVILFGNIARLSTDGVPQLLFYLFGSALWTYFSSCVSRNASTFTDNAYIFGKIYFPRLVMPVSVLLSSLSLLLIQLLPALLLLVYYLFVGAVQPHWAYLPLVPPAILLLGLMGMGTGIVISSMTTRYRDLNVLVGFGLQLWMYGSPVVYPLSTLSGLIRELVLWNPVTAPVELLRYALFGSGSLLWGRLLYSLLFTLLLCLCGIAVFNRVERTFMDTV